MASNSTPSASLASLPNFSTPTPPLSCKDCGESAPEKFYTGTKTRCKTCHNKRRKHYRPSNYTPEQRRAYTIKHEYGITLEEYEALLLKQEGRCAVCFDSFTSTGHVDHDHATGKVRGILCASCNKALGFARDNVLILQSMIAYLGGLDG